MAPPFASPCVQLLVPYPAAAMDFSDNDCTWPPTLPWWTWTAPTLIRIIKNIRPNTIFWWLGGTVHGRNPPRSFLPLRSTRRSWTETTWLAKGMRHDPADSTIGIVWGQQSRISATLALTAARPAATSSSMGSGDSMRYFSIKLIVPCKAFSIREASTMVQPHMYRAMYPESCSASCLSWSRASLINSRTWGECSLSCRPERSSRAQAPAMTTVWAAMLWAYALIRGKTWAPGGSRNPKTMVKAVAALCSKDRRTGTLIMGAWARMSRTVTFSSSIEWKAAQSMMAKKGSGGSPLEPEKMAAFGGSPLHSSWPSTPTKQKALLRFFRCHNATF